MKNLLKLFTVDALEALLHEGYTIFIRQTYPQGLEKGIKEALIITPYKDIGEANEHFQYIRFDHRKYMYHTHRPDEVERLHRAAEQPEGYRVYFAGIDKKPRGAPTAELLPLIKRYVRTKTKWRPGDGHISVELILHYGVLCVSITGGPEGEEKIVSLEDLQKL